MASLFTALSTMCIPLALIVWLQYPSSVMMHWIGIGLIFLGIAALILGWRYVIREERQRRNEGKVFLYVLTSIAEKLGVDIDDAVKKLERVINR